MDKWIDNTTASHELILRCLAVFMVGVVTGAVHSIWSLHTYIPLISDMWRSLRAHLGQLRPKPPNKGDIKWFLTSLFGFSGAGAVAAGFIDGKRGIALYFVGLCFAVIPVLAAIIAALVLLVAFIIVQVI